MEWKADNIARCRIRLGQWRCLRGCQGQVMDSGETEDGWSDSFTAASIPLHSPILCEEMSLHIYYDRRSCAIPMSFGCAAAFGHVLTPTRLGQAYFALQVRWASMLCILRFAAEFLGMYVHLIRSHETCFSAVFARWLKLRHSRIIISCAVHMTSSS